MQERIWAKFKETWLNNNLSKAVVMVHVVSVIYTIDELVYRLFGFGSFSELLQSIIEFLSPKPAEAQEVNEANVASPPIQGVYGWGWGEWLTLLILLMFVYAFYQSIQNDNADKRKEAKSHANFFGGVLIGSVKSVLGG